MKSQIRIKNGKKIKVEKFLDFDGEKEYFAVIGEKVYVKCPDRSYEILIRENESGRQE